MFSLVLLLSGNYPLPAMHSLLVTINHLSTKVYVSLALPLPYNQKLTKVIKSFFKKHFPILNSNQLWWK